MVDEKCTRGKRIIGPKPKEAPPEVGEVGTKNATNKEKTERDQTKKKPQSWKNKKINDIFNIWLEFNWFLLWFVFIVFMKQKSNRNNRGFTEKNMKKENKNPFTKSKFEHVFYCVDEKKCNKKIS